MSGRRARRIAAAMALVLAGCHDAPPGDLAAERIRQPGVLPRAALPEASGAAASRGYPGRFWTLNDSGNPSVLYLLDTLGTIVGTVRPPIRNRDWEALASGPCGDTTCLYIADIGDNGARHKQVTLYRAIEPTAAELAAGTIRIRDSLEIRYRSGPRDAEALVVGAGGEAAIISKGWEGTIEAFRIPAESWGSARITAEPFWTLPIVAGRPPGGVVTDATLSPDGERLAVRTYREVHIFTGAERAGFLPAHPAANCFVGGLEPLGEGITWWNDSTLLLTSEARSRPGPITLLECPAR
ncbi:MAG: hypothetical protein AB7L66_05450 [Gemmatimonadales bacterium]